MGAQPPIGFWGFVKAAFGLRSHVPLLGSLPLNKLALVGFGILGLGHPGFWLLGLAFEAAYLTMLAGNPRFQNLVRARQLDQVRSSALMREDDALRGLDPASRDRFARLRQSCRTIITADPVGAPVLGDVKSAGLNDLLNIFLRLLTFRARINDTLARTRREDLSADIEKLKERIEAEKPESAVRRSIASTLEIQQTRLANLDRADENLRYINSELERIEKQANLVAEEAALSRNPEQWSASLDAVVRSMQDTSRWMTDNSQLIEQVEVRSGADLLNAPVGAPEPAAAARPTATRRGRVAQ